MVRLFESPEELKESDMSPAFPEESTPVSHCVPNLTFNFTRQASSDFYKNDQKGMGADYAGGYTVLSTKTIWHST